MGNDLSREQCRMKALLIGTMLPGRELQTALQSFRRECGGAFLPEDLLRRFVFETPFPGATAEAIKLLFELELDSDFEQRLFAEFLRVERYTDGWHDEFIAVLFEAVSRKKRGVNDYNDVIDSVETEASIIGIDDLIETIAEAKDFAS